MGTTTTFTPEVHVSDADAFTLRMERDPLLRSTIVAVSVFDRAPDWEELVRRIERATRLAPTFREKLVPTPLRLAPPRWVVDPDFDLSWHLRRARVPEGGGLPAVIEFARTTGMTAFDHDRPLWEFTLIEGLPDGQAALVMKVHHALTDGIGGVQIAAHVVDLSREPADLGLLPPPPVGGRRGALADLGEAVGHDLRAAVDVTGSLLRSAPSLAVGVVKDPVAAVSGVVSTAGSLARFVRPITTTRSPVMRDRRLQWHYDVLDVPLAPLKAAAATVDGTLNDAFVAAIGRGFRRYHDHHGAVVDELRMCMPISLRTGDDAEGGNHVTLVRFDVPIGPVDPGVAMKEVGEACRTQRHEPALAYSNQVAAMLNLLPVAAVGGMLKHVDLLTSNVPGFPMDVFVAGAKLEAFYPFGPTIGAAANVTLMSYRGTCHMGVTTDAGAVPDPDVLMRCLRESFDEILATGRRRPRTAAKAPRGATTARAKVRGKAG
jgi:WS/DGAT/MGAT family acyltransferase